MYDNREKNIYKKLHFTGELVECGYMRNDANAIKHNALHRFIPVLHQL